MLIYVTSAYSDPEPLGTFLRLARHAVRHRLAVNAVEADAVLFVENSRYHQDPSFSALKRHPFVRKFRQRCFMYNEHDRPWCLLPGVYCSMPKRWFQPRRQRATRYLRLLNPVDTQPSDQPDILFSFLGNSQISLRKELLKVKSSRAILEETKSFNPFLAQEWTPSHIRYAEVMRRSKFVLCPRGCGTSSIRLFETLRAGRVPIIVSDQWVAPAGPDWSTCSLWVREGDITSIDQLACAAEQRWPEMATKARQVWDRWFADEVLFDRIADAIAELLALRTIPEAVAQRLPNLREWNWRIRRGIHYVRSFRGRVPLQTHALPANRTVT